MVIELYAIDNRTTLFWSLKFNPISNAVVNTENRKAKRIDMLIHNAMIDFTSVFLYSVRIFEVKAAITDGNDSA